LTSRWKPRVLAGIIVFLTLTPILIFSTDATQRGPFVTARNAAMQRAGVTQTPDSVREARARLQRQQICPALKTAALGMMVQLIWAALVGLVGRKLFALRL
jgi:hypothetical protein